MRLHRDIKAPAEHQIQGFVSDNSQFSSIQWQRIFLRPFVLQSMHNAWTRQEVFKKLARIYLYSRQALRKLKINPNLKLLILFFQLRKE